MSKIVGIYGLQGCGKTMAMTVYGLTEHKLYNRKIYSNYHINGIPYTPITSLEDLHAMRNGVALLDEFWLWLFSRSSQTKINKEINKVVMLNRKRHLDIYYTAQLKRSADVMLREVTSLLVYPEIITSKDKKRYLKTHVVNAIKIKVNNHPFIKNTTYKKPVNVLGKYYNTDQEIDTLKDGNGSIDMMVKKGIQTEKKFVKACKRLDFIKDVILLPNSGKNTGYDCDVLVYLSDKTLQIDVKGSNKNYVYLSEHGEKLLKKIDNAHKHNAIPYLAFYNKRWYLYKLTKKSYLLNLSSYPRINKLINNSKLLFNNI